MKNSFNSQCLEVILLVQSKDQTLPVLLYNSETWNIMNMAISILLLLELFVESSTMLDFSVRHVLQNNQHDMIMLTATIW